ncbi:hypothetical protein DYB34_001424 [Aphanomyces astaci]|uniref:Uncharacterized protein n=1 Tax=Aphanomyces astaci TaxID=112090 RepID=A0A397ELX1_APHAT|nr:hypothetical protein DYB34_001424 [Aphanomyces astaci]RHY87663.1 hypothetical protein DYB31_005899 [Aphanomyces astaci]
MVSLFVTEIWDFLAARHDDVMDASGEDTEEQRGAASLLQVVQKELQAHTSAIRVVLTKLAERLVALERRVDGKSAAVQSMETLLHSMTGQLHDLHGNMGEWQEPVQMMRSNMQALVNTCDKLDQTSTAHSTLLERQAHALHSLNTKLDDTTKSSATSTKQEIEVLVQKTDSLHGHVLQQLEHTKTDLATKLDDVTKKVNVLDQDMQEMKEVKPLPPPSVPPPVVVPVLPEGTTKIPVEVHARRLAAGKPKGGPLTDLKQFRIPDDMQERLEHNIAALYATSVDDLVRPHTPDALLKPAADVLPWSGTSCRHHLPDVEPPTSANLMAFVRHHTQDDSVSATADMRNHMQSKFRAIYAMVNAARVDARGKQDALHVIMNRHVDGLHAKIKLLREQVHQLMPLAPPHQPAAALLVVADHGTTMAYVPALRLALLELSRNLHVVRQSKKHMSVDMRRNVDKILDVLNDAYHVLSSDETLAPAVVIKHTERVARVLAFGIQSTVELLSTTDAVSSKEMRNTLVAFSDAVTSRLQASDADEGARRRAAAVEQQLEQLKTDTHGALLSMSARLDELKQRGTMASLGERGATTVQSRHDINERGKLLAAFEHDLHQMKLHLQTTDAMLQKLSSDLEHTTRLVSRYVPNVHASDGDSPSKAKKYAAKSSRATLQALNPCSISATTFPKQTSLSTLCVQNALRQPIRKAPFTPPSTKHHPESS